MNATRSFVVFCAFLVVSAAAEENTTKPMNACDEKLAKSNFFYIIHMCGTTYYGHLNEVDKTIINYGDCPGPDTSPARRFYVMKNQDVMMLFERAGGGIDSTKIELRFNMIGLGEESRRAYTNPLRAERTTPVAGTEGWTIADLEDSYHYYGFIVTKRGAIDMYSRKVITDNTLPKVRKNYFFDLATGKFHANDVSIVESIFDGLTVRRVEGRKLRFSVNANSDVCENHFKNKSEAVKAITIVGPYSEPDLLASEITRRFCEPIFFVDRPVALIISMAVCHILMYLLFQAMICQRIGMHDKCEGADTLKEGSGMGRQDEKSEIRESVCEPSVSQVSRVSQINQMPEPSQISQDVSRVSCAEPQPSEAYGADVSEAQKSEIKSQLVSAISKSTDQERKVAQIVVKPKKSKERKDDDLMNL